MIVFKGNPEKLKEFIYKDGKLYNDKFYQDASMPSYFREYNPEELFDPANEHKDIILFSDEFKENFNSFVTLAKKLHGVQEICLDHVSNIFLVNEIEDIDEAMKQFTHNFFTMLKPQYDNTGAYLKGQVIYLPFTRGDKTFIVMHVYLTLNVGVSGKHIRNGEKNLLKLINGALNKIFPHNLSTTLGLRMTTVTDDPMTLYSHYGFIGMCDGRGSYPRLRLSVPGVVSKEVVIKCCSYTGTALDFLDLKLGG